MKKLLLLFLITLSQGSYQDKHNNRREAVFDGDPLTFFDASDPNGSRAGLDLGEAKAIRKIIYVFRNVLGKMKQ
jgi:hypothetical protein